MTKKRLLSLLLALALALSLLPAAAAAGKAALFCELDADGTAILTLEDLSGSGVYGVQVEVALDGEYRDCTFTPASRTAYAPDCTVQTVRGETRVTVYVTGQTALDEDGYLDLGVLDLGAPAEADVWPDTARVTLLDKNLRTMSGAGTVSVTVLTGGDEVQPQPPESSEINVVLPFADVGPLDWFYGAVGYVYSHGMMNGVAPDAFDPGGTTDRAMIVTILHRLEGSPAALPAAFTDVPAGQYYALPVAWAAANGIVTGYSPTIFQPQTPITREQLATILYRYVQYKGVNTEARGDLSQFPDAAAVSLYAAGAMSWAVGVGLITGSDGLLVPGGNATRAQTATIFQRLCENLLP